MKLLIGIPAYNEAAVLEKVIRSLPKSIRGVNPLDILVVDDGSSDRTASVAQKCGAIVLRHRLNRGLGGALKTIFAFAAREQYDMLITFDADGQHKSTDIPRLIEALTRDDNDVVIGTRWRNKAHVPASRRIINQLANILTFTLFGVYTTDSQSGLRCFSKKAIGVIRLQTDGMEVSSEFFKEIYRNKLQFAELPIDAIYTKYSRKKGQRLSNFVNVFFELFMRFLRQ